MKIVLNYCDLRVTKNSLDVAYFCVKLAEELEVNSHWQNDPNRIITATSTLWLNCPRLETILGPEVTSL